MPVRTVVKRPIPVQVIEWTGANIDEIRAFCTTVGLSPHAEVRVVRPYPGRYSRATIERLEVRTAHGWVPVAPGDYVAYGGHDLYPLAAAVLAADYSDVAERGTDDD